MARAGERKCLCCLQMFMTDRRNRGRQRYCEAAACRRASKTSSQAAWLGKAENVDYFRDATHVVRVQAWRSAHPGYARGRPRVPIALQDSLVAQVVEPAQESGDRAVVALQDDWAAAMPVVTGLIAHVFDLTLQEDMAVTTRRLVQLGQDLINGSAQ